MEILRTPDARFAGLSDYPFEPHYTDIDAGDGSTLRIHHLDEGDRNAPIVLCLHGQPSWSYLYRKMVPLLVKAGLRVIAPDLPGYGKSDKPAAREDYSYQRQVDWMGRWLEVNDFSDITLFGQDWGGLIGLRLVVDYPERMARVVMGNTGLPYAPEVPDEIIQQVTVFRAEAKTPTLPEMSSAIAKLARPDAAPFAFVLGFAYWQKFCWETESLPVGFMMESMVDRVASWRVALPLLGHQFFGRRLRPLTPLGHAYEAPFPDAYFKMGPRAMPSQVPTLPTDPSLAAQADAWAFYEQFEKPFLCLFTADDPVTFGAHKPFIAKVPGAAGLNHQVFDRGGHFLQERCHHELSQAITDLVHST